MKEKGKETKKVQNEKPDSTDSDFVKLGKRMRELRIKKGFKSFETFAYDNELPRVLYGNYEKGVGNITYKNLLKVIRALGISLKEFFSEGVD
ncbi:MAG: helix-turn-helix domain-containing protein [Bacteroidetes bacterium]|nr:helix-turn-helix domain-containing protein [Bacteroidota bacterium]